MDYWEDHQERLSRAKRDWLNAKPDSEIRRRYPNLSCWLDAVNAALNQSPGYDALAARY